MTDQQVERAVKATFEIYELDESVYDEHAEGPKLTGSRSESATRA
ncbi:hypothetical protein [Streptomyces gilvosporeus]|nr:hypothetical protein [Streptomyces gilvosporeus]